MGGCVCVMMMMMMCSLPSPFDIPWVVATIKSQSRWVDMVNSTSHAHQSAVDSGHPQGQLYFEIAFCVVLVDALTDSSRVTFM